MLFGPPRTLLVMRLHYALPLLGLLILAAPARAQTYIKFFELPGDPSLHGLDYHDGFLWAAVRSSSDPRLLQIDPADGSVLSTIPLGEDFPTPLGVTWDGANFRVSESFTSSPEVFTVSPAGAVLSQISAPSQLSNGLALHDGTLFVAKAYPDDEAALVGVDPADGAVTETIAFPSTQPGGLAIDVALSGEGIDPDIDGGDPLWTLAVPDNPNATVDDFKVTHLAAAGDLNGDGAADLVVGTENYYVFAVNGDSWNTGDILWSFDTCPNNFNCGAISGVDGAFETALETGHDLDGDGVPDVVFSTDGGSDHVFALSGADGSLIWEVGSETDPYLAPYYSVSARFDITGDGVPDVSTGTGTASDQSPDPLNDRRVYLLDGATGDQLWERQPGLPSFVVEQISLPDGVFVVAGGASEDDGFVTAWAADDGTAVWTHTPDITPFVFAPYPRELSGEDLLYTGLDGLTQTNRVVRLDGATGEVVWERTGLNAGWSVAVTGDLNGNGAADVAVGFSSGVLRVFDGADGEPLWFATGFTQVFGVAALPDVTGDGISDLAAATGDGRGGRRPAHGVQPPRPARPHAHRRGAGSGYARHHVGRAERGGRPRRLGRLPLPARSGGLGADPTDGARPLSHRAAD
jgi:outer membrane protein assembly factor BamB